MVDGVVIGVLNIASGMRLDSSKELTFPSPWHGDRWERVVAIVKSLLHSGLKGHVGAELVGGTEVVQVVEPLVPDAAACDVGLHTIIVENHEHRLTLGLFQIESVLIGVDVAVGGIEEMNSIDVTLEAEAIRTWSLISVERVVRGTRSVTNDVNEWFDGLFVMAHILVGPLDGVADFGQAAIGLDVLKGELIMGGDMTIEVMKEVTKGIRGNVSGWAAKFLTNIIEDVAKGTLSVRFRHGFINRGVIIVGRSILVSGGVVLLASGVSVFVREERTWP